MKQFLMSLKNDFFKKWKSIILLLFCCLEEIFLFSIIAKRMTTPVLMISNIIFVILILFFTILAIKDKKPTKEEIKKFLIFVILALLFGLTRSYIYIFSLIIAYLFIDNKKQLYKWIFIVTSLCFCLYVAMVFIAAIENPTITRISDGKIIDITHALGFNNANHPMKFYFTMMISGYLWLCDNKKKTFIFTLILLIPGILISKDTDCRTGLLICVLFFVCANLSVIFKVVKAKWLYILFTILTIFLVLSYQWGFDSLNKIFSGRPLWYNYYFKEYPEFILFGKCYYPLVLHAYKYPLDNGFLYILFDGGIFAFIAINIIYFISFKNNKDEKITLVLFCLLAYSLAETLSTVFMNLLYVIMFSELLSFYHDKKGIVNKETLKKE